MELENFISKTLSEIQKGVDNAIKDTTTNSGVINPCFGTEKDLDEKLIQEVKFNIAVTASEQTNVTAGGGIKVVGVHIGADGGEQTQNSHISRIQFSIPMIPPVQIVKQKSS